MLELLFVSPSPDAVQRYLAALMQGKCLYKLQLEGSRGPPLCTSANSAFVVCTSTEYVYGECTCVAHRLGLFDKVALQFDVRSLLDAARGLGCIKRDCGKAWTQLKVRFSAFPPAAGATGLADKKLPATPCRARDNRGADGVAVATD